MSVKALNWVIYDTPKTLDAIEFRLLVVMADIADKHGKGVYKGVRRYAEEVGCSTRTVQSKLRSLEQRGLIAKGDQMLVQHLPANRRPTVYDICMAPIADTGQAAGAEPAETTQIAHSEDTGPTIEAQNMHPNTEDTPHVQTDAEQDPGVKSGVQKNGLGAKSGVQPVCTQIGKEDPNTNPVSPRAGAREDRPTHQNNRSERFDLWSPNLEARALATELHADIDSELRRFKLRCTDNQRIPDDPDAAFRKWLRQGANYGRLVKRQPPRPCDRRPDPTLTRHTHRWDCEHVLELMGPHEADYDHTSSGFGDTSEWALACQAAAAELNRQEASA